MKTTEFKKAADNHLTKLFWLSAGVIILCKLLLVGKNEIVALPYDSLEYVRQAAYGISSIGSTPKGYPIWLWVTNFFGVPQRIVIELLYLSTSLMLAYFIGKVISGKVGAFVLLLLAFSPNSFFLFDKALSDGFYMCLTLGGVALSISVMFSRRGSRAYWINTFILGWIFGLMLITRNEGPLIGVWVAWLIIFLWLLVWGREENLKHFDKLKSAILLIFVLAVTAYGTAGTVVLINIVNSGVAASSLATIPGHLDLLKNLAAIDTKEEPIRYVPVTRRAREMAYAVSPTLRELKLVIESPENLYQSASRQHNIPDGEIGAGWIWHVFNSAAFNKVGSQGVRGVDAYYRKINLELEYAFSRGALEKRFVIHPLFANNLFAGVDYFHSSFLRVVGMSLSADRFQPDMGTESGLFDRVCVRRSTFAYSTIRHPIQGWVIADSPENNRVESVQIETKYAKNGVNESSITIATEMHRYDVVEGYKKSEGRVPDVFGFRAELSGVRGELVRLVYVLSDGRKVGVKVPLKNGISSVDGGDRNLKITQGLDLIGDDVANSRGDIGFQIQNKLISLVDLAAVKIVVGIILVAGLIIAVVQTTRFSSTLFTSKPSLLVIFISGVVIFRIGFYTLIDAAAWSIDSRYLAPANALLLVILALALTVVSQWVLGCLAKLFFRRAFG